MTTQILVFNCGSSSIKFSLVDPVTGTGMAKGLAERIGSDNAEITLKISGQKQVLPIKPNDYPTAMKIIFQQIKPMLNHVMAVGHRVVHGGKRFTKSVLINQTVIDDIKNCISLAPLHNPANLQGIQIAQEHLPKLPHIACFDTAFHTTLPNLAYTYPIPYEWQSLHDVRRYGFHGLSYQYVSQKAIEILKLDPNHHGILIAHLGNGCSACAVQNGHSIDTTMGFTPLDGLMMGTRSGCIDPGIHAYICNKLHCSIDAVTSQLNKNSGLKGVSGLSHDCRDLENAKDTNERAALAIDLFCYRLAKQLAGLATTLKKIDALIFTAGIGENSALIREKTVQQLTCLNFSIDKNLNATHGNDSHHRINQSQPAIAVIPTNEEWQICQDAVCVLKQQAEKIWL